MILTNEWVTFIMTKNPAKCIVHFYICNAPTTNFFLPMLSSRISDLYFEFRLTSYLVGHQTT
jgi:hypothetical protein